jgi:hypothetical protein
VGEPLLGCDFGLAEVIGHGADDIPADGFWAVIGVDHAVVEGGELVDGFVLF